MIRFVLGILILLALAIPAEAQHSCDRLSFFHHVNATGPIEIIPADPTKRIYFCGFMLTQKGNTLDFEILLGHGTNCDTDTQSMMFLELPNDFALTNRIEQVGPVTEYGWALCIKTSGSNAKLGGVIYWAQF